uniref:Voltage-gated hydrogen channel 1 n=1 Tax=Naja naja TaxID=35670 RepID=A0A8C6YK19_NAJNA
MSMYLKHFTVVGDNTSQWNNDYKKWEEEETEEERERKAPEVAVKVESVARQPTFRDFMKRLFQSHKFQIVVVCLVILDAVLVLGELLLDLKIIHPDKEEIAPRVLHYLSLSILSLFLVEVSFKLFAYRLEFFHHKFEVLDALVVVVSFILDIVVLFKEHQFEALGLLILLRLWRVARIINGTSGKQGGFEEQYWELKLQDRVRFNPVIETLVGVPPPWGWLNSWFPDPKTEIFGWFFSDNLTLSVSILFFSFGLLPSSFLSIIPCLSRKSLLHLSPFQRPEPTGDPQATE